MFLQLAPIERLQPVQTRQELEGTSRGTGRFGSTNDEDMTTYFLNQEKDDKPVERQELTTEQDQALNQLLNEYEDIFAAELHELGRVNQVQHVIDTGNERPIR